MSRLFHTEQGMCAYLQYEAVSARRRARKELLLPEDIAAGGTLYLLAKPFPECAQPLRVRVNDQRFAIAPTPTNFFSWQELPVVRECLRPGMNTIEIWADNTALDGWALGMESGYRPTGSWLSLDGGQNWQNERMGINHALSGEYIVRLRVDDQALRDPEPPAFTWENPDCPELAAVREAVPAEIRDVADPWERARALAAWTSVQWEYRNTKGGIEYAPWDALTILAWGRAQRGPAQFNPIVMCVHFGVVFATCALALGLPARNVCVNAGGPHTAGHFISEVWIERWQKWCQVDGNCDVVFERDGVPLSVDELSRLGKAAGPLAVTGEGYAQQGDFIKGFVRDFMLNGLVYQHWAVWPRNDYLSRPELTPPAHGSTEYVETAWQWSADVENAERLGMFSCRVPAAELAAPPSAEWQMMATRTSVHL
ncbi:MAG: transglutaminase-like domain-containing protein [Armatimonadota bacterium]